MELHPIIDSTDSLPLTPGLWYVASCDSGAVAPSARVGATCTFNPAGKCVNVIGGADPDGAHADVFCLRMKGNFGWEGGKQEGLKARYEHAAFTAASYPKSVFIFGGADVNGNSNSIQMFDVESGRWSTPSVSGSPPSPRTYRVSHSACRGDRFYVFSGGDTGSQPVGDRQLHCFDASTMSWQTLCARGTSPKPRHGHSLIVLGGKVVIFGGMSGHTFYNDLAFYDLDTHEWTAQKSTKSGWPSSRAGHGAVVIDDQKMVVFGGMSGQGALDDLWVLDSRDWKWRELKSEGPPPASRLDFAMTVVHFDSTNQSKRSCRSEGVMTNDATEGALTDLRRADSSHSTSAISPGVQESVESDASLDPAAHSSVASSAVSTSSSSSSYARSFHTIMSADQHSDLRLVTDENEKCDEGIGEEDDEPIRSAMSNPDANGARQVETESRTLEVTRHSPSSPSPPSSTSSSVVMIFGGMDTEGEIFDDCLMYRMT